MTLIEIDLSKIERGTHIERVKVTRKGKTFYRKQRVGRKEKDEEKIKWKPIMSLEESEIWSKDSKIKGIMYHGTSKESEDAIKKEGFDIGIASKRSGDFGVLGQGIYMTPDRSLANFYAPNVSILKLRINVKNPLSGDKFAKIAKEKNYIDMLVKDPIKGPAKMAQEIIDMGYDGIIDRHIVIFDPEDVVIIEAKE